GALVVADTTAALLACARLARDASPARFVAITGSVGKTTTKAFLAQLLRAAGEGAVEATPANENNEFGVAKLLLGLLPETRYVVVEIGARHFGEIAPLARIVRPQCALLTAIGDAHLEIMGSPERLAETKWGIFAGGGFPVLAAADVVVRTRAATLLGPRLWFADAASRTPALRVGDRVLEVHRRDTLVVRDIARECFRLPISLAIPGDHNRANAAAAAAAALGLGLTPQALAAALGTLELPRGRYERIAVGEANAIYDAYNASCAGTLASLRSFAREPARRRIAVLAGMAELGEPAARLHREVGRLAGALALEVVLVSGEFAGEMIEGAREAGLAREALVPFGDNAEAAAWLRAHVLPGDLVLFKGSRRYRLEEVLAAWREGAVAHA
ncbi:MAG: Mur ligase family protein, partial [Candidatus Dormibacteria bacterium]